MRQLRFPGKTFLVGEYAVLEGGEAVLLGHGPQFHAEISAGTASSPFHPESPAGRWLQEHPFEGTIRFQDPHRGQGGFGGSGAEFLSAWAAERALPTSEEERHAFAWAAWEASRAFPGSGADILTQAYGMNAEEHFLLRIDIPARQLEPLPLRGGGTISLFHTGKKLDTHGALRSRPPLPLARLQEICLRAAEATRAGNFEWLAGEINAYGKALSSLGLLAPHSAETLEKLKGMKGVLAAKGCGAMGADVLLVAHEPNAKLLGWALENSLAHSGSFPV